MDYPTKITLGDYQLAYQSFGTGVPTVEFESGREDGADWLAHLAHQVQSFSRALIYDRAGLGHSDPAPHVRAPSKTP